MSTLDADALATLTPEEREAIEGSEHSEADLEALKKIAGDADEQSDADDGDDDDDSDDDGDDDAPPAEVEKPAPAEADPAAEAPAQQPEAAAPRYEAKLPSDYDDQIKSLKERDAELRQKFKDGEIDIDERDAGLAEIQEQRESLLVQRASAETFQRMAEQDRARAEQQAVLRFVEHVKKTDGIDYLAADKDKVALFDRYFVDLRDDPKNIGKSHDWLLAESHKRVKAYYMVSDVTPSAKQNTVQDALAKRKPPVDAAPKTLAQVPGSDGPGDVGSEFADIEALEGMEYEDAIARMSPAQREKFLRGR